MYRWEDGVPEVLLGHLGGPYWARKDDGAWTVPKGLVEHGEGDEVHIVPLQHRGQVEESTYSIFGKNGELFNRISGDGGGVFRHGRGGF